MAHRGDYASVVIYIRRINVNINPTKLQVKANIKKTVVRIIDPTL